MILFSTIFSQSWIFFTFPNYSLFLCFDSFEAVNFAMNIKTLQMSELRDFTFREYQNVVTFAPIFCAKLKMLHSEITPQNSNWRKFKKMFILLFSSASYFYPSLLIFVVIVFPTFLCSYAGQPDMNYAE